MDITLIDSYAFVQEVWCPEDEDQLFYYEACLAVENALNVTISLYKVEELCYMCEPEFWTNILPQATERLLVAVDGAVSFQYNDTSTGLSSCVVDYKFEQHGIYSYLADFSCDDIEVVKTPSNLYSSLFVYAVLLVTIWVLYMLFVFINARKRFITTIFKRRLRLGNSKTPDKKVPSATYDNAKVSAPEEGEVLQKIVYDEETGDDKMVEVVSRGVNTVDEGDKEIEDWLLTDKQPLQFVEFDSLLALRGLTVCSWVFLFVEGNTFVTFKESRWNGFRLADIPTGWLYWVLAASVYLRLRKGIALGQSRMKLLFHSVLLRGVLYMTGGFIYNNINNTSPRSLVKESLGTIRIPGLFQRVGLALTTTSLIELAFVRCKVKDGRFFGDVLDSLPQWTLGFVLLLVHTFVTYLLPVPDCPTGYTGPGGRTGDRLCTGGAAGYIDRAVFSNEHLLAIQMFEGFMPLYKLRVPFDPHGLLGTLTTCFLMTSAMHAARIFIYFRNPISRSIRLITWSFCHLLFGGLLCGFSEQDGLVPSNPHLMSISYTLLVSGFAYLALFVLHILISVKKLWSGFPLIDAGINMLIIMAGNSIFQRTFPFQWMVVKQTSCTEFLLMASWSVFVWCLICNKFVKNRIICPV